jgi:hypothetical protein
MRLFSVLIFFLGLSSCLSQPCFQKLDLSKSILVNENESGNPEALIDEQEIAGDPLNKKSGNPKTLWFTGWGESDHPASVFINLRNPATLSAVYLRDINDIGTFKIEAGTPGHWYPVVVDSLKRYEEWSGHTIDVTTQYLRFTRVTGGSNVSEVVLYGCMLPDGGAPTLISDLRIQSVTDQTIKLVWTSTGDDEKSGESTQYDIRYSTSPILKPSDFEKATVATEEPTPRTGGTKQTYLVRGLSPKTVYYFAAKAIDDVGKVSPVSNTVSGTTADLSKPKSITMDKAIGANVLIDDPIDRVKAVGFIREYHSWEWDEADTKGYLGYPDNRIKWAPSEAGGGSWNFDNYYTRVKEEGLDISPVIQGTANWLQGSKDFPFDNKPLDKPGAKPDDPNSYQAKAHHLFQFAARYGATKINVDKLTLDPGQSFRSGLDLVHYVEDWNEPDKDWLGPAAKFLPQEYAAMASANYDGHAGTMTQGTKTFGVKNADPKIKFVMGGILGVNLKWIEQIQYWFENNRADNAFVFDVINIHHYSWKNGNGPAGGGPAKSPEEDDFKGRMKAIVDYRDKHFPNVEVWISEFGWDTNQGSPLAPPVIAPFDAQEIQAQWLVRAYLAFAAAGVDRASMYMLRDLNSNSNEWFASCGLTGPKGDWAPKKSWYYVYTLKTSLTNMVYMGEEPSTDPNVLIYKFKNIDNSSGAYVVWSRTKINYTLPSYKLKLTGSPTVAKKVELTVGKIDGTQSSLSINKGFVTTSVSERPVIILVDDIK